eukprot:959591-Rhodomonas_salina.1
MEDNVPDVRASSLCEGVWLGGAWRVKRRGSCASCEGAWGGGSGCSCAGRVCVTLRVKRRGVQLTKGRGRRRSCCIGRGPAYRCAQTAKSNGKQPFS